MQRPDGRMRHWRGARAHPGGPLWLVPPDPRNRAAPERDLRWRFGRWPRWDPRWHSDRPRKAVTVIELLVVIVIIGVLVALLMPTMHRTCCRSRGSANLVKCGSNLRQIGQALMLYANENKGAYPRTIHVADRTPVWGTGPTASNPFTSAGRPAENDITAAVWLLIRTQDITPEVFVCPSSDAEKDTFGGVQGATAMNQSNFTDWRKHLSYSFANPYPSNEVVVKRSYKLDQTTGAEFAVAADLNPGVGDGCDVTAPKDEHASQKVMQHANSRNHQKAGQNVLYGDGHVDFVQNPFVGTQRDNIYTRGVFSDSGGTVTIATTSGRSPVGVDAMPAWAGDSVLLPPWK